jgi:cytoskeletal protein CcmA (bactofilin family)
MYKPFVTLASESAENKARPGRIALAQLYPGVKIVHDNSPDCFYRYSIEIPGKQVFYLLFNAMQVAEIGQTDQAWGKAFVEGATAIHPSSTFSGSPTVPDPATIGKSLQIKGEVTGSESLYIDGKVEGAITLPDSRVTVSRDAQVSANITAREVVIFGKVCGNITASDRVDIRSEGSVTGDVTAQRITMGEGAFFKGGMDISKPGRQRDRIVGAISANGTQTAA